MHKKILQNLEYSKKFEYLKKYTDLENKKLLQNLNIYKIIAKINSK